MNRYIVSSGEAGRSWDWRHAARGERYGRAGEPNVEPDLKQALITNPDLYVQVDNGYYDFATPFFATEYTMNHLGLPAGLQDHISLQYLPVGPHDLVARAEPGAPVGEHRLVHRGPQRVEAVTSSRTTTMRGRHPPSPFRGFGGAAPTRGERGEAALSLPTVGEGASLQT